MKPCFVFIALFTALNSSYAAPTESLKNPWPQNIFETKSEEPEPSILRQTLLWLPNRILDLIDVFKIDAGVGPALGGVVRVTKYAQAGIRTIAPMSVRVGLMGRQAPFMIETSSEIGISPAFSQSDQRNVCPGEFGLGLDLGVSLYAGVCVDEAVDFLSGLFLVDIKNDDHR